jgi:hypothetical protein
MWPLLLTYDVGDVDQEFGVGKHEGKCDGDRGMEMRKVNKMMVRLTMELTRFWYKMMINVTGQERSWQDGKREYEKIMPKRWEKTMWKNVNGMMEWCWETCWEDKMMLRKTMLEDQRHHWDNLKKKDNV